MRQQERHGKVAEKVTENIIEDLMTNVLDWSIGDLNNQIGRSDILLTHLGIGYLIVETKRLGKLAWNRRAVEAALGQARRYASEQNVNRVAVSDGVMFYAADIVDGGLRDRVLCRLDTKDPAVDLWWLSVQGIWRSRPDGGATLGLPPYGGAKAHDGPFNLSSGTLLHPRYGRPARCFAYVGDASRTSTWKLPFRLVDGSIDTKRLPKAIGSILTNYRGAQVHTIPEKAIPAVLTRLAEAAQSLGYMPPAASRPAPVYLELAEVLKRLPAGKPIKSKSGPTGKVRNRPISARPRQRTQPSLDSFS